MAQDLEQALGRNVRARRLEAGLTQTELAERANISLGALKHLEQGAGSTTKTLTRVLRVLGAEGWIDRLAPAPSAFNPLDLLEARSKAERHAPAQRVRRARGGR